MEASFKFQYSDWQKKIKWPMGIIAVSMGTIFITETMQYANRQDYSSIQYICFVLLFPALFYQYLLLQESKWFITQIDIRRDDLKVHYLRKDPRIMPSQNCDLEITNDILTFRNHESKVIGVAPRTYIVVDTEWYELIAALSPISTHKS